MIVDDTYDYYASLFERLYCKMDKITKNHNDCYKKFESFVCKIEWMKEEEKKSVIRLSA